MKFDQLQYFAETARNQHIGKAAKKLAVTPSTISHSIRLLEEELGRKLFDRVGRSLVLTEQGKEFWNRSESILREMESLKFEFLSVDRDWEGSFKIALTHGLGPLFISKWAATKEKYPRVRMEILSRRTSDVIELVANGEVDVGLCFSPVEHPRLESRLIRNEALQLVVKKGHPLLKLSEMARMEKLASFPNALPKPLYGSDLGEIFPALKRYAIQITTADLIHDTYVDACEFVKLASAWSLIPESIAQSANLANASPKEWNARLLVKALSLKSRRLHPILDQTLKQMVEA